MANNSFVEIAVSKNGLDYSGFSEWARSLGTPANYGAWCADFVMACAKVAGILGEYIAISSGARQIVQQSGEMSNGFYYRDEYSPNSGDLVWFNWNGSRESSTSGNHVGIVVTPGDSTIQTIEGNTDNQHVRLRDRPVNYQIIGYASIGVGGSMWGDLYGNRSTKEDAILREVAFEENYELVNYSTRDKISVVNYTDIFAELFNWGRSLLAPAYNLDNLEENCRIVIEFFLNKGWNAAAACGVAGNIKAESGFDPSSIGDNGTSFGICQWHQGRGSAMKQFCSNWQTDLTGQLEYLWYELHSSETGATRILESVPNSEQGCMDAADAFVRKFERPQYPDTESIKRQAYAIEYYTNISTIIIPKSTRR